MVVGVDRMEKDKEAPDLETGTRDEFSVSSDPRVNLPPISSGSSFLGPDESGFWESPRPALEHCKSAPVRYNSNSLVRRSHELILSRSKTDKKEATKFDLKLNSLSESEKKKIIEDIVKIQSDGTMEVDVDHTAPVASELLELDDDPTQCEIGEPVFEFPKPIMRLNIAILVVGTRGDVQPFLAIAKRLQEFGHRVRLASHVNFRNFVMSHGVDFYPLGGDPRVLTSYMARNKGSLLSGPAEINIQRKQLKEIIDSLLPACTEPDMDTGVPFKAQAIIANPPAYGHAHVAEALGVPLHIFFTMPWTQADK